MNPYDEEKKDDAYSGYSPREIRDLEQEYSTPQDEREDRAIERGADPENLERGGTGRDLRLRSQAAEDAEAAALEGKLSAQLGDLKDALKVSLYSPSGDEPNGKKKKKYGIVAGGGVLGLILVLGPLFGFLNLFQLDSFMQNVEQKTMTRLIADSDRRSSKFITAYMMFRLMEVENSPGGGAARENGLLLWADKVDRNKPLTDWYRTMRLSSFEADLLEKHNIKFVGMTKPTPNGGTVFKGGYIDFNNSERPISVNMSNEDMRAFFNGDLTPDLVDRYRDYLDVQGGDSTNREARQNIKRYVNDIVPVWQVFKRRAIRSDLQNTTGVTDWRFFDTTRSKIDEKVVDTRAKFIKKAFPNTNKAGLIVQCLFGTEKGAKCRGGDPADPNERANNPNNPAPPEPDPDSDTDSNSEDRVGSVDVRKLNALLTKVAPGLNFVAAIDTLDMISNAVTSLGNIKGLVSGYKGAQAMGVFTTLTIARDQLKTGEASAKEVDDLMEIVGNGASSEGWDKVISSNGSSVKAEGLLPAKNQVEYCSESYQEELHKPENQKQADKGYAYLCPEKQVGGLSGAATNIDSFFDTPFGKALKQFASAWQATTDNPVFDAVREISQTLSGIVGGVVEGALKAAGLSDNLKELSQKFLVKVSEFVGLAPLIDESSTSGEIMNANIQGGAYASENSMRYQGAAQTTPETKQAAIAGVTAYHAEKNSSMSLIEKYASLENTSSFAAKTVISVGQSKNNIIAAIAKLPQSALSFLSFASARAEDDPYAASNFAGIETYDFPKQCLEMNPILMTPQNATNITSVIPSVNSSELTWELLRDKNGFYDFLYSKLGSSEDATKIAVQVYNCALLDRSIMGATGALYGYTDDGGLDQQTAAGSSTEATNNTEIVAGDTTNVPCAAGTDQGNADGYRDGKLTKIKICDVRGIVVNSQISGNIDNLLKKAKADGIKLGGFGFRTMDKQKELRIKNGCPADPNADASSCSIPTAKPGYSNHQLGVAIDFTDASGQTICFPNSSASCKGNKSFEWIKANAGNFGLKNLPEEAWHWSVDGS